jgi:predicted SnoaL-like aldol condensation-catalyzing enzyme
MLINPNETYEVYVDMVSVSNGSIAEDWDVTIPEMVLDPNDKKPED